MLLKAKNGKKILIVHTPGKVGSTTVYVTLKEVLGQTHNIFHFHHLSEKAIDKMTEKNLRSKRKSLPLHLLDSTHFANVFDIQNKPASLIVLIREPISRYISAMYQNLNMYFKDTHGTTSEKIEHLILNGLAQGEHLTNLEWWFHEELKSNLGIDVFQDDHLVHSDLYWFFKRENINIYLLKMESLNEVFPKFCERELGLNEVQLVHSNVGGNKSYSKKYASTKNNMHIPLEIVRTSKKSPFFKRFYTEALKS